jgi:UDP-2,3-diacylglucosamine pyrophosphatase LpxH
MARKSLTAEVADGVAAARVSKAAGVSADAEQVTQSKSGDVLEARSTSRRIKTVEDLLRHIEADMSRFEIAASEATKWECGDGDGSSIELHRVFVRLKPKGGPTTREIVQAMIDAARKDIARPVPKMVRKQVNRGGLWQVLVVADTHFGAYAWGKTTGGSDYDLDIAGQRVADVTERLLDAGGTHSPQRRTIAFLGDLFHFDTPAGTTTGGTPLERDGRLQKVIDVASNVLLGVVEMSAASVPTDVLIVNGNHDEVLTWAFQRILRERFRGSKSVTIKPDFTGRQYLTHGKNLLGFAHGHKAKRKLPQIMALEQQSAWSVSNYREWHTGHLHHQAAEHNKPLDTLDSVIVRTAPTVCPPDDWHSANGFIGSRQAMETFIYSPQGGLIAMHVASPTVNLDRAAK